MNIDGLLLFADYFFDGLFADWAVGNRIQKPQSSVQSTRDQIVRMLDKLDTMETATQLEEQLDMLTVKG